MTISAMAAANPVSCDIPSLFALAMSHTLAMISAVAVPSALVVRIVRILSLIATSEAPPQTIEVRRSAGVIVRAGSSWQP